MRYCTVALDDMSTNVRVQQAFNTVVDIVLCLVIPWASIALRTYW